MTGFAKVLAVIETGLTVGFLVAAMVLPVGLVVIALNRLSDHFAKKERGE